MHLFGLIGYPIQHSRSPLLFQKIFEREDRTDCSYQLFPLTSINKLPLLLQNEPDLSGFNVTHPYKESILPYLDELSDEARIIGAVNTVSVQRNNTKFQLTGYNTDCEGFRMLLQSEVTPLTGRALILGTGGAAKAVAFVLQQLNIPFTFVSRTPKTGMISYQQITPEIIKQNKLIINATPVGMISTTPTLPSLPYNALTPHHLLIDLIYNPPKTAFLNEGIQRGARCLNGTIMLEGQAEASWEKWR